MEYFLAHSLTHSINQSIMFYCILFIHSLKCHFERKLAEPDYLLVTSLGCAWFCISWSQVRVSSSCTCGSCVLK